MKNSESTSNSSVKEEEKDEVISALDDFLKFKTTDEKTTEEKPVNKRKRTSDEDAVSLEDIISMFLKIIYPLSACMKKFVVVGVNKKMDSKPCVILNHNGKIITLTETAWNSLDKRMQLIDCYLKNRIFGKKTSFSLMDSDVEVDVNILRGEPHVRLRDVTKHDIKVQLNHEEFLMFYSSSASINNYINQLRIVESCCKDYIISTIDTMPTSQILYSPLDTSIMNRLPQEVELYRRMITAKKKKNLQDKENKEENAEKDLNDEDEDDDSTIEINSQDTNIQV